MIRIRLSLAARRDILDGSRFIGSGRPQAALAWQRRLQAAFVRLVDDPGSGHPRPDLSDDVELRFWRVDRHLIVYRHRAAEGLIIFRVLHGSRDIASLLDEEPPTVD